MGNTNVWREVAYLCGSARGWRRWAAVLAMIGLPHAGIAQNPANQKPEGAVDPPAQTQVTIVVPTAAQGRPPTIEVRGKGQEPLKLVNTEAIPIIFGADGASLSFKYPSGLLLTTQVRRHEGQVLLPVVDAASVIVRNEYGLPIAGAALEARGFAGRFSWFSAATTAATGRALISLPDRAESTRLAISAEGYTSRVRDGEVSGGNETVVSLESPATIRGAIVSHDSANVAALMRVWKVTGGINRVLEQKVRGPFSIGPLASGDYELEFVVSHLGTTTVPSVTVISGQSLDIGDVDLTPNAAMTGTVADKDGQPLKGVRVRLPGKRPSAVPPPEATTDVAGRYAFQNLLSGEYHPELFHESRGWLTFPDDAIVLLPREALNQPFTFAPSGCSLVVDFLPSDDADASTYLLQLPVTDSPAEVKVSRSQVTRTFPSVPCEGAAVARRVGQEHNEHMVSLGQGESRLTVLAEERTKRVIQLRSGGRPLANASVWAEARDSDAVVPMMRTSSATDDTGQTSVSMPGGTALSLYVQVGGTTSIVYNAKMSPADTVAVIDLPSRSLRGVITDARGLPIAATLSGHMLSETGSSAPSLPDSSVTQFFGLAASNGTFEIKGIAHGRWLVSVAGRIGNQSMTQSKEIEIKSSEHGETAVRFSLSPR